MKSDTALGAALGAALAGASVMGNLWRGDTSSISVFPDLLSLLFVPGSLFIVLRRKKRAGVGKDALHQSGRRIATIAAALFAVVLAAFATVHLSNPSPYLIAGGLAGTFVVTCIVGYASVAVMLRGKAG